MTAKTYQAKRSVGQLLPSGTANRLVTTPDGTTMAMAQATTSMLGPGAVPRTATKIVAAVNASAQMLAAADYVCDGVADEVQINAALAALPASGGTVQLSEGTFTLAAGVTFAAGVRRALRGMGMEATTLVAVNAGGVPINTWLVRIDGDYDEVSDLTVDGNRANNASATSMVGVESIMGQSALIERVRVLNSMAYGIVTSSTAGENGNAIVRDCLLEGCVTGILPRAPIGRPVMVTGCTAKGNTGGGFVCGAGPVVFSDCQAISNAGAGFTVGVADSRLTNCTAQSNGAYGFNISGANTQLAGCRAISNTSGGFITTGAGTQFVGCTASVGSINGHGFTSDTGAIDTLYSGCMARDTLAGYACFYHASAGRSTYVGCQALNYIYWAFRVTAGEIHVRDCYAYGASGSVCTAISLEYGANHVIDGCRIVNNGGYGVYSVVPNVQITNNSIYGSSLNANNTYDHIIVGSTAPFIHGNVLRDPPSGNRPARGINVSGATGALLGLNQTSGVSVTAEVVDGGTNTRQLVKVLLDYATTTDVLPGSALTAGVWIDVIPDQAFRVENATNTIEITCFGSMRVSGVSAITMCATQLIIDATTVPITRPLGYEHFETTTGAQNPLAGANPIKINNLAVGTHTVKLQVRVTTGTASAYLRATSPTLEYVTIQVLEYVR